jgi:hypothetical protein
MYSTQSVNWQHGLLFSTKQSDDLLSCAAWLTCSAMQRCRAIYTHVALLYDGKVYECCLRDAVSVTDYDSTYVHYATFMPLHELSKLDNVQYSADLDVLTLSSQRICTVFVVNALRLAGFNLPTRVTPDELYALLTL